jgi:hypothetical protein
MNYRHPGLEGAPRQLQGLGRMAPLFSQAEMLPLTSAQQRHPTEIGGVVAKVRCSPPLQGWPSTDCPLTLTCQKQHQPGHIGAKVQQQSAATAPTDTDPRRPVKSF